MTLAGKYMRLSQHKSIKQEDSSLIISTDVFLFFFCLSCHWLCFQGLSVTRSNRLQGLHSQAWVAATADASLKWPCFYSRSKPVCLFFWCFNVAWHVKMCNLGPVVLSLELKCILLEGKKKKKRALNLALHWCHAMKMAKVWGALSRGLSAGIEFYSVYSSSSFRNSINKEVSMFFKRVFLLKDLFAEAATEFGSGEQGIMIEPVAGERDRAEGKVLWALPHWLLRPVFPSLCQPVVSNDDLLLGADKCIHVCKAQASWQQMPTRPSEQKVRLKIIIRAYLAFPCKLILCASPGLTNVDLTPALRKFHGLFCSHSCA